MSSSLEWRFAGLDRRRRSLTSGDKVEEGGVTPFAGQAPRPATPPSVNHPVVKRRVSEQRPAGWPHHQGHCPFRSGQKSRPLATAFRHLATFGMEISTTSCNRNVTDMQAASPITTPEE